MDSLRISIRYTSRRKHRPDVAHRVSRERIHRRRAHRGRSPLSTRSIRAVRQRHAFRPFNPLRPRRSFESRPTHLFDRRLS
jgi:hypothetical protein